MPHRAAATQRPAPGDLCLDHVAHFVEDLDAAAATLGALGFVVTERSGQVTRDADGQPAPAGMANRCVMLEAGYLEFLAPVADTPTATAARALMARYDGVHLLAIGTPDAAAEHARLERHEFAPQPLVALEREVASPAGPREARFSVVRVPPGRMPEGRIQFVEHHTPEVLWRTDTLAHANGVVGLRAVLVCADDPPATAARFAHFLGALPARAGAFMHLAFARGQLLIGSAATCAARLGAAPVAPALAGYVLACRTPGAFADRLTAAGANVQRHDATLWRAQLPAAIGGACLFGTPEALSDRGIV